MKHTIRDEAARLSGKSYLWALSYLKPYKGKLALLVIFSLLSVTGETLTPKVIQHIIDHVIPQKDIGLFWTLLAVLVLIHVVMLAAKNGRNLLQLSVGELASGDIVKTLFLHLRRLGFEHYERQPAGETLAMFNTEVTNVSKIYRQYLPDILENFFFVAVSIGIMAGISGWMSLVIIPSFA